MGELVYMTEHGVLPRPTIVILIKTVVRLDYVLKRTLQYQPSLLLQLGQYNRVELASILGVFGEDPAGYARSDIPLIEEVTMVAARTPEEHTISTIDLEDVVLVWQGHLKPFNCRGSVAKVSKSGSEPPHFSDRESVSISWRVLPIH
jgi:hypothetical protein